MIRHLFFHLKADKAPDPLIWRTVNKDREKDDLVFPLCQMFKILYMNKQATKKSPKNQWNQLLKENESHSEKCQCKVLITHGLFSAEEGTVKTILF